MMNLTCFFIILFVYVSFSDQNKVDKTKLENDTFFVENTSINKITPVFLEDVSFRTLGNKKFTFNEIQGKVILLNVWATWCGPCKKEQPLIVNLIDEINDPNFQVVSVSIDKDLDAWEQYLRTNTWAGININIGQESTNPLFKMVSKPIIMRNGDSLYSLSVPQYFIVDKQLNIEKIEKMDTTIVYKKIIKKLQ